MNGKTRRRARDFAANVSCQQDSFKVKTLKGSLVEPARAISVSIRKIKHFTMGLFSKDKATDDVVDEDRQQRRKILSMSRNGRRSKQPETPTTVVIPESLLETLDVDSDFEVCTKESQELFRRVTENVKKQLFEPIDDDTMPQPMLKEAPMRRVAASFSQEVTREGKILDAEEVPGEDIRISRFSSAPCAPPQAELSELSAFPPLPEDDEEEILSKPSKAEQDEEIDLKQVEQKLAPKSPKRESGYSCKQDTDSILLRFAAVRKSPLKSATSDRPHSVTQAPAPKFLKSRSDQRIFVRRLSSLRKPKPDKSKHKHKQPQSQPRINQPPPLKAKESKPDSVRESSFTDIPLSTVESWPEVDIAKIMDSDKSTEEKKDCEFADEGFPDPFAKFPDREEGGAGVAGPKVEVEVLSFEDDIENSGSLTSRDSLVSDSAGPSWEAAGFTKMLPESILSALRCSEDTAVTQLIKDPKSVVKQLYDAIFQKDLDADTSQPHYDEEFTLEFLHQMMTDGATVLYLESPGTSANPEPEWKGRTVTMSIEPGTTGDDSTIQPRIEWTEVAGGQNLDPASTSMRLLKIISINSKVDEGTGDYEGDPVCFFSITTNLGEVHVFEAFSRRERDRLVNGLRNVMSRLAFQLITGDTTAFSELYCDEPGVPGDSEHVTLVQPHKDSNRLAHDLLD